MDMTGCFEYLPEELLLLVLEYLSLRDIVAVSHACRRWWYIASQRVIVVRKTQDEKRLLMHPYVQQILVATRCTALPKLLDRVRFIHTLIVHKRIELTIEMFKTLEDLPNLTHLDVFMETKTIPSEVIPVTQRLKTFVINDTVAQNVLRELAHSHITQLHMYGRSLNYDPRAMTALIAARRPHLTELTLRCNELPALAYQEIANCPKLSVLRLYTCWLLRAPCAVNITGMPTLRVLHITGARMLWASQLKFVIEVLPKELEELCFSGNCFSDEHIEPLVSRGDSLRVLELWNTPISNNGLCLLAMNLPCLREFDIDTVLRCEQLDELSGHPTLEKLRCRRHCFKDLLWDLAFDKPSMTKPPVATACARYASGSMRMDANGFRSGLFYHWSVDHPPLPLPCCWNKFGNFSVSNDAEDNWSLLGPDLRPRFKLQKWGRKPFQDSDTISLQSLCRTCCTGSPIEQLRT